MTDVRTNVEFSGWDMLFFGRCYDFCSKVGAFLIAVLGLFFTTLQRISAKRNARTKTV